MANRFWVGGTATWDATAGTKWATTSGGAGGAAIPTAADDVFFDAASGAVTVTVGAGAVARSIDCTGFTGTLTGSTAMSIGDSGGGGYKLVAGMGYSYTGILTFAATADNGGTGWPITTASKSMPTTVFDGVGGKWQFQDSYTTPSTRTITLNNGALDTNSQTISASVFTSNNSNTRSLTLGSSSITLTSTSTAWNLGTSTNMTLNAGTSSITLNGAAGTFTPGSGLTYYDVSLTGSGAMGWSTGSFTCHNFSRIGTAAKTDALQGNTAGTMTVTNQLTLQGNSATNRLLFSSSSTGTARNVVCNGTVVASNVDFSDIAASGTASWNLGAITGGSGDALGNSGITFTTSATQTWQGTTGGNWSDVSKWTSRVPLPQDDIIVASAFAAGTQSITMDMPRSGRNIDLSGSTSAGTARFATSTGIAPEWYGSVTLVSFWAWNGTIQITLRGRSSHTFTSNGDTIGSAIGFTFAGPGSTWTLADAFNMPGSGSLTVNDGTWNTNNQSVSCQTFSAASGRATTLNLGSSVISLTASSGTIWTGNANATVVNAGTSEIVVATASASNRTMLMSGSITLPPTWNKITYTVASSTGVLIFGTSAGNGTFMLNTLNVGPSHAIRQFVGSTIFVQNFLVSGSSGNLVTIDTTTAGTSAKISKQYIGPQGNVYSFFGTAKAKDGHLLLDGASGTYASTPDPAGMPTGDITISVDVAMDDWSPAGFTSFVTQRPSSSVVTNAAFGFRLGQTSLGRPEFYWTPDGVAFITAQCTVGAGTFLYVDGTRHQLKVTLDVDNGAGGWTARFYRRDSDADPWVQAGADVTGVGVTSIFDSTAAIEFGSIAGGTTHLLAGKIYKAELRSGIDGTIVASPDFTGRSYNTHDYLSIKDSTASGYGVWYAGTHSTNVSGNTGWIFDDPQREGWGVLL